MYLKVPVRLLGSSTVLVVLAYTYTCTYVVALAAGGKISSFWWFDLSDDSFHHASTDLEIIHTVVSTIKHM